MEGSTGVWKVTPKTVSYLKYLSQGFNVLQQVYTLTAPTMDDVLTFVGSFSFGDDHTIVQFNVTIKVCSIH